MSERLDYDSALSLAEDIGRAAEGIGGVLNELPWATGAYNQMCSIWAGTGVPQGLDAIGLPNLCSPYLADQGRTFGESELPFTGGQCEVEYRAVQGAWSYDDGDGNIVDRPPAGAPSFGPGPLSIEVDRGGQRERLRNAAGSYLRTLDVSSIGPGATIVTRGWEISRSDGQPDDCGDPPPFFSPGAGYEGESYGDEVPYTDGNGDTWNLTVDEPTVLPDGTINIPVTVNGIDVDINPGGSGGANPGPSDPGNTVAGDPQTGGNGNGDRNTPDPPAGFRTVALSIEVANVPSGDGRIPNTSPNERYYAVIGNAAVRVADDEGNEYWGTDYPIRSKFTLLSIPVEGVRIVGYRVNVPQGVLYRATTINREEPTEE